MKQLPFLINSSEELECALAEVRSVAASMGEPCVLVSVLLDRGDEYKFIELSGQVRAVFPAAQIFGSVSSGEIINGKILHQGIVVGFSLFASSRATVYGYAFADDGGVAAGGELLAKLNADPEVRAVKILGAGLNLNPNPFLEVLSSSREDIVFFGGLADDGTLGAQSMVFAQGEIIRQGVVVVVFSGADLHVEVCSSLGWRPLGRSLTVTSMDGMFCVKELDDRPIVESFERYLGITTDDDIVAETTTFPFYVERDGMALAREPIAWRDDGGVVLAADLYEGEQVRLAYGDPNAIIENAVQMQQRLAEFRPEAIYIVSCMARWVFLAQDTEAELTVSRSFASSTGFYAYGEFMRAPNGHISVSNMTMVTVGMREGGPQFDRPVAFVQPQLQKRRSSIIARLVKLVQTTTQELEDSHEELARLVRIDRLTGVLNRGATERRLEEALARAQRYDEPLSVLMMDIDDFKHINDNYGHAIGDLALRELARLLTENTRIATDAPGRWGGDEFFIVFSHTELDIAADIASRILTKVRELKFLPDGTGMTTSIGVVAARPDDTPDTLYTRADRALYRAKLENGKNNVTVGE